MKQKMMNIKQKRRRMFSQIYSTVMNLLFTNTIILQTSFTTEQKELNEFKTNLELFYKETIGI